MRSKYGSVIWQTGQLILKKTRMTGPSAVKRLTSAAETVSPGWSIAMLRVYCEFGLDQSRDGFGQRSRVVALRHDERLPPDQPMAGDTEQFEESALPAQ